ncbi:MAG TPA: pitrilysin family protein, partial [Candidatus Paceibacterota bacterium]|nr:pitrilysin family protein [Candidatus Paceibacterota bacterium]
INMYEDNPQRNIHNIFMALVYGDQPAGWDIPGPRENIRKFVQKDFLEYRKKHYVAKGTIVTVAGDIDVAKVEKKIREIFADISTAKKHDKLKTNDTQTKPAIKVAHKDIDQAHMVMGVRSFDLYDKQIPALSVMQSILSGGMSGRLWHRFREELGICYYVRAFSDAYTDHGIFGVWAGVDKNRVGEAIGEVCKAFKKLADVPVSKGELRKVKDGMIGRLYLGLESSDDQAMFYGSQEIHHEKLKDPKDVEKEIEKVTAKDIQDIAKKIFVDKTLNCAIIGPFKDNSQFSKQLTFGS